MKATSQPEPSFSLLFATSLYVSVTVAGRSGGEASGRFHSPADIGHRKQHRPGLDGKPLLWLKQPHPCMALASTLHTFQLSLPAPHLFFMKISPWRFQESLILPLFPPIAQHREVLYTFECPRES